MEIGVIGKASEGSWGEPAFEMSKESDRGGV